MDIEPGINDFDVSELEWLTSLTRNGKSILGTRLATRFSKAKVWQGHQYLRQLQIVIRILSVIQEFRRLYDVLDVALVNNTDPETLASLITAIATWHPPLEGMGLLSLLIDSVSTSVYPSLCRG
jgi:hypothetical protein